MAIRYTRRKVGRLRLRWLKHAKDLEELKVKTWRYTANDTQKYVSVTKENQGTCVVSLRG